MTTLTLLAPVIVDLHAVPGSSLAAPDIHADFWARAAAEAPGFAETHGLGDSTLSFPGTSSRAGVNLYRSLEGYSGESAPHLFAGTVPIAWFADAIADHGRLGPRMGNVSFKAFDHGIVLVECTAVVTDLLAEADDVAAILHDLEGEASALGADVARRLVLDLVQPYIGRLHEFPGARDVLDFDENATDGRGDLGSPMWVTRSLMMSCEEAAAPELLQVWLRDATDSMSPAAHHALLDGDQSHHVRWVNYAFVDRSRSTRTTPREVEPDVWAGLEFAQYFYSALDRVDSLLSEVLARSADTSYQGEFTAMRGALRTLSQRAELIIMDKQRVSKYLNRRVRSHLDGIMAGWHYETVLEEPVRFKIDLCSRRLDDVRARRQARSALVTDIILLLIGVTSILATALSLSDFGRSMATDATLGSFDLGSSRLTAWFAGLPADTLLVSSGLLSLLLIVSYAAFRGDADS